MLVCSVLRPWRARAALAALLVAVAGCGGGPLGDADTVEAIARAVVEAAPEAAGALRTDAAGPLGPVEVYVDASLSIQPYFAGADGASPFLPTLIETLDNALGGEVRFHAFGFEAGADSQTVAPVPVGALLRPTTYTRVNNDFEVLFRQFAADSTGSLGPTRVVLTDGVESDPEGGARFGRIVADVDRWLHAGGAFATFLYRAPYSGRYFSEGAACPRGAFPMTCADRPLVAFVFAPRAEQIHRLLLELGDGAQPEHTLLVGGRDATLVPEAEVAVEGSRRPLSLLRKAAERRVRGFEPIPTGLVNASAADADGFVPLSFRLTLGTDFTPWARLSPAERDAFLAALRPEVRAWSVSARGDSVALDEVEPFVLADQARVVADSAGARVVVPVQRPRGDGRHFAWLVSLVPYGRANSLVPAGYTTVSDCDAAACGRTLNLAPLLGAILRDDYVPARVLLLTEWR